MTASGNGPNPQNVQRDEVSGPWTRNPDGPINGTDILSITEGLPKLEDTQGMQITIQKGIHPIARVRMWDKDKYRIVVFEYKRRKWRRYMGTNIEVAQESSSATPKDKLP